MNTDEKFILNNKVTITKNNLSLIKSKYSVSIKGCPLYPWSFFNNRADLINHFKHSFKEEVLERIP